MDKIKYYMNHLLPYCNHCKKQVEEIKFDRESYSHVADCWHDEFIVSCHGEKIGALGYQCFDYSGKNNIKWLFKELSKEEIDLINKKNKILDKSKENFKKDYALINKFQKDKKNINDELKNIKCVSCNTNNLFIDDNKYYPHKYFIKCNFCGNESKKYKSYKNAYLKFIKKPN